MKLADLGEDFLWIRCPECKRSRQFYRPQDHWPGDMLVIKLVARHFCKVCSQPGHRVRAIGEIEDYPRSGARG